MPIDCNFQEISCFFAYGMISGIRFGHGVTGKKFAVRGQVVQ